MKSVLVALALVTATPAPAAQPPSPAQAAQPSPDPERLALARQAVAALVPDGTMERMMKESMGNMEDAMLQSMFDMKASDIGETGKDKDKTLRESIAAKDPHFEERMKITNRVMKAEMAGIMGQMEPRLREGMTKAYARRFTVAELTEINRFFASPAGASFARQSFEMANDPEIMAEMMAFMPEMMRQMPAITDKIRKATAHLPPPATDDDEDSDQEDDAGAIS